MGLSNSGGSPAPASPSAAPNFGDRLKSYMENKFPVASGIAGAAGIGPQQNTGVDTGMNSVMAGTVDTSMGMAVPANPINPTKKPKGFLEALLGF